MRATKILFQNFDHPLFEMIDRKQATYKTTGVVKRYVVEDPLNSDHLLYLNRAEYLKQLAISLSNDIPLEVLAAPGDRLERPESEK